MDALLGMVIILVAVGVLVWMIRHRLGQRTAAEEAAGTHPWLEQIAAAVDAGDNRVKLAPLEIRVAGVTKRNADRTARQTTLKEASEGDRVRLEREPGNRHDKNAVKIIHQPTGRQIGYVPREDAIAVSMVMDWDTPIEGQIVELSGGRPDFPIIGCRVELGTLQEDN